MRTSESRGLFPSAQYWVGEGVPAPVVFCFSATSAVPSCSTWPLLIELGTRSSQGSQSGLPGVLAGCGLSQVL